MSVSEAQHLTAFQTLPQGYRDAAQTRREQGTCFEELILACLRHELACGDLYSQQPFVPLISQQNLECSKDAQMGVCDGCF